jgi:hypothetical protein
VDFQALRIRLPGSFTIEAASTEIIRKAPIWRAARVLLGSSQMLRRLVDKSDENPL